MNGEKCGFTDEKSKERNMLDAYFTTQKSGKNNERDELFFY